MWKTRIFDRVFTLFMAGILPKDFIAGLSAVAWQLYSQDPPQCRLLR